MFTYAARIVKTHASGRSLIGFILAVVVGGGGGSLLGPLAADPQSAEASIGNVEVRGGSPWTIEKARGVVKILSRARVWRRTYEGETFEGPAGLSLEGSGSALEVSRGGLRARAYRGARILIGGAHGPAPLQLDRGHLVLTAEGSPITTSVPSGAVSLRGQSYGVWIDGARVVVSALGASVELVSEGGETTVVAAGHEAVVTQGLVKAGALPARLEIQTTEILRRGLEVRLVAKTWPNAIVEQKARDTVRRVELRSDGMFEALVDRDVPEPGALVAYDSAGRSAEVGRPSGLLSQTQVSGDIAKDASVRPTPVAEDLEARPRSEERVPSREGRASAAEEGSGEAGRRARDLPATRRSPNAAEKVSSTVSTPGAPESVVRDDKPEAAAPRLVNQTLDPADGTKGPPPQIVEPKEPAKSKTPKEMKEPKEPKELGESKEPKDPRDREAPRPSEEESQSGSTEEEPTEPKETKAPAEPKESQGAKDREGSGEAKQRKESEEAKDSEEPAPSEPGSEEDETEESLDMNNL